MDWPAYALLSVILLASLVKIAMHLRDKAALRELRYDADLNTALVRFWVDHWTDDTRLLAAGLRSVIDAYDVPPQPRLPRLRHTDRRAWFLLAAAMLATALGASAAALFMADAARDRAAAAAAVSAGLMQTYRSQLEQLRSDVNAVSDTLYATPVQAPARRPAVTEQWQLNQMNDVRARVTQLERWRYRFERE